MERLVGIDLTCHNSLVLISQGHLGRIQGEEDGVRLSLRKTQGKTYGNATRVLYILWKPQARAVSTVENNVTLPLICNREDERGCA
jgi:hypothetical protein